MLGILAVILIHSSPFDEIVQGEMAPPPPPPQQPQMEPQPLDLSGGQTIQASQFIFTGNKAISSAQLQRLTNPFLYQSLSENDISEIEQRIQLLYRSKGYPDATAMVVGPVTSGTITIVIKEGEKSS